jgi:hypothetical protein
LLAFFVLKADVASALDLKAVPDVLALLYSFVSAALRVGVRVDVREPLVVTPLFDDVEERLLLPQLLDRAGVDLRLLLPQPLDRCVLRLLERLELLKLDRLELNPPPRLASAVSMSKIPVVPIAMTAMSSNFQNFMFNVS